MKTIVKILCFVFLYVFMAFEIQAFVPVNLKTEHNNNPVGVDTNSPRLSWNIEGKRKGIQQTAYRIIVSDDSTSVLSGIGDMWDTGKYSSDLMLVEYNGKTLKPFTKYYWRVVAWNEKGKQAKSTIQSFETGLIYQDNWFGKWIDDGKSIDFTPAPYFRKQFNINKKIVNARAYIAVAGLFELYCNGEKVGNHVLDPVYSRFDRRNYYLTHDVTNLLKIGENVIGVILGNGWYNHQSLAVWNFERAPWRNRPTFCMDVRLTYDDGSKQIISTDDTWLTSTGGLILNSIYTGEHVDFNLEPDNWNLPDYYDSNWEKAHLRTSPSDNITSQQLVPIRYTKEFSVQKTTKFDKQNYVFDFGQNISGVTKLKLRGKKGSKVQLIHGERLFDNGHIDLSNIDVYYRGNKEEEPFQTDVLILSGGIDEFMPKFNYKGFRYLELVADDKIDFDENDIKAYFIHSDVESIAKLSASNPLISQLQEAANNSYLSNLMGYPTDCPQREKNGWTGDGHFAIEAALYNFDAITIYEKWLADHRDEQREDGVLPDIIPTSGWGYGSHNGLDWTSSIAIIPWEIYRFYGDSRLLRACYDNIKLYVDYVNKNYPGGLTNFGRGDWVPVRSVSDVELTSSIYYYVVTDILAKAAQLFDKTEDYQFYSSLATEIKRAINNKFLDVEKGIYASGTQTELSMPLYWGIVPDELIAKVADNLANNVIANDYHLDVGVLGAKAILNALSENTYADIAYKVAVQDTYPSWGWWIKNGANTLLENWDLDATRDISDNHMMFGEIGAWFYKGIAGYYPTIANPGFKEIELRPNFISELDNFSAEFKSPYGWIKSKWERKGSRIKYQLSIPPNSKANLYLPDDIKAIKGSKVLHLKAGTYTFRLKQDL